MVLAPDTVQRMPGIVQRPTNRTAAHGQTGLNLLKNADNLDTVSTCSHPTNAVGKNSNVISEHNVLNSRLSNADRQRPLQFQGP